MDALFSSLSSALGASVDQIKARSFLLKLLYPFNAHDSDGHVVAHILPAFLLPSWKPFHPRSILATFSSPPVQRRRYCLLFLNLKSLWSVFRAAGEHHWRISHCKIRSQRENALGSLRVGTLPFFQQQRLTVSNGSFVMGHLTVKYVVSGEELGIFTD